MNDPRTLPVPELSEEIEQLLVAIQRIHLADPNSFWFKDERLSLNQSFVRRVVYYLQLYITDPVECKRLLIEDQTKATDIFKKWWDKIQAEPWEEYKVQPISKTIHRTKTGIDLSALNINI